MTILGRGFPLKTLRGGGLCGSEDLRKHSSETKRAEPNDPALLTESVRGLPNPPPEGALKGGYVQKS
jgi:hypothetical protein